jgi:hypothetical protein
VHGYTTAFWCTAGIFAGGAAICGALVRWLSRARRPQHAARRERRRRPAPAYRHNPAGSRTAPGVTQTRPKKADPYIKDDQQGAVTGETTFTLSMEDRFCGAPVA